jgi:hypothetical protein
MSESRAVFRRFVGPRAWRALFALALSSACAMPGRSPDPRSMSGFLDDYSRLREGRAEQPSLVYRNPRADWARYDRILFEPVTIWRSGKGSLDGIAEEDLQRVAAEFHATVRARLGESYQLVGAPGPGVIRIRLGITDARQADSVLDVFTFDVPPAHDVGGAQSLGAGLQALTAAAAIEGEIIDTVTGELLAACVDRRPRQREIASWQDLRAALDRWASWLAGRLEKARTGQLPPPPER